MRLFRAFAIITSVAIIIGVGAQVATLHGLWEGIKCAVITALILMILKWQFTHAIDKTKFKRSQQRKAYEAAVQKHIAARRSAWPFKTIEEAQVYVSTQYAGLFLNPDEHRRVASLLFFGWVVTGCSSGQLTLTRHDKTKVIQTGAAQ
jgi:ABC-type transport system involved in cytochrome bd biosynthesis fused ATPase/permease subunit